MVRQRCESDQLGACVLTSIKGGMPPLTMLGLILAHLEDKVEQDHAVDGGVGEFESTVHLVDQVA